MDSIESSKVRHPYKGIKRVRSNGRIYYKVNFIVDTKLYCFGFYNEPKEAARAHDMFVLKNRINRETNIIKKQW